MATSTRTLVDDLISACTNPCQVCGGSGVEPARAIPTHGGLGVRRVRLDDKCDRCRGVGFFVNQEGHKLASFLRASLHV